MTVDLPPPSSAPTLVRCPACGTGFPWPPTTRCRACAADLTSEPARRIWDIDRTLSELTRARSGAVAALVGTRPERRPAAEAGAGLPVGAPPAGGVPTATARPRRPSPGVPTILGLAGAALLTAAAAVFTAVAWDTLPTAVKALILLAATAGAAAGALALHRRDIPVAAASVGLLALALVVVDVNGAERAGLLTTAELVPGMALLAAAAMGAWLCTRDIRWVGPTGAASLLGGAAALTAGIIDLRDLSLVAAVMLVTGASTAVAITGAVWPERLGRLVLPGAGVVGVTLAGLVSLAAIADGEVRVVAGMATLAVPLVVLAAGTLRTRLLLAPVTLLVTLAVPAVTYALGAEPLVLGTIAAATIATLAWALPALGGDRALPIAIGALPAAIVGIAPLGDHLVEGLARLGRSLSGLSTSPVDAWGAIGWTVVAVGVLSLAVVRRHPGTVAVATTLLVAPALPGAGPWIALVLAGGIAVATPGPGSTLDRLAALVGGAGALLWAAPEPALVAIASVATAALAVAALRDVDDEVVEIVTTVGLLATTAAAGAATYAAGAGLAVALGAALAVAVAAAGGAITSDVRGAVGSSPVALAVTTVVVWSGAPSLRSAGVLLLGASIGWLLLAVLGIGWCRWIAAGVASAGNAALLRAADVAVVEAYTAVPAILLLAVGLHWMRERRDLPSHLALWPGLSVGLTPSLLLLASEPTDLVRALALAVAAGALAVAGLRLRWRAPVVAGAAVALWVSATQLSIVVRVVERWVTFAVVGALLVWLAATYERQQRRVVGVGRRLLELR